MAFKTSFSPNQRLLIFFQFLVLSPAESSISFDGSSKWFITQNHPLILLPFHLIKLQLQEMPSGLKQLLYRSFKMVSKELFCDINVIGKSDWDFIRSWFGKSSKLIKSIFLRTQNQLKSYSRVSNNRTFVPWVIPFTCWAINLIPKLNSISYGLHRRTIWCCWIDF